MNKNYTSIGKKTGFAENSVHLIHFILGRMKNCCLFPPDPVKKTGEFYSSKNVCAALFAYLYATYPDDPHGALGSFGIQNSSEVGVIAAALQSKKQTRVVKQLEIRKKSYVGLFKTDKIPDELLKARWYDDLRDNESARFDTTAPLLKHHFRGTSLESLVIIKRQFPTHVRADLQVAVDELLNSDDNRQLFGLSARHAHEGIQFQSLSEEEARLATRLGPLTYTDICLGGDQTIGCLTNGLWLCRHAHDIPYAVLLGAAPAYASRHGIQIEIAVPDTTTMREFAQAFMVKMQQHVESSKCYRGKILSFERESDYRGHAQAIKVHELREVSRDEVILPKHTLELLDRNVIEFVKQRPSLAKRGMSLKKGLLLFGPPGTGKTHTVHYLSRAMPGTTTIVITAEQVGLLSEYMTLARLLQPSLVVIEDADLIARQREYLDTCEELLLNKLLNEMDGLKPDAEVIFLLTTNRPEALEAALTARPGRIDQAIEFPLPDQDGRARLAKLYSGTQPLDDDVIDCVVSKTDSTNAAFIKELMRRATQYAIARGVTSSTTISDVETAVEEMLFSGGAFNRQILGAVGPDDD